MRRERLYPCLPHLLAEKPKSTPLCSESSLALISIDQKERNLILHRRKKIQQNPSRAFVNEVFYGLELRVSLHSTTIFKFVLIRQTVVNLFQQDCFMKINRITDSPCYTSFSRLTQNDKTDETIFNTTEPIDSLFHIR